MAPETRHHPHCDCEACKGYHGVIENVPQVQLRPGGY
jgi:hypothetical protein